MIPYHAELPVIFLQHLEKFWDGICVIPLPLLGIIVALRGYLGFSINNKRITHNGYCTYHTILLIRHFLP